MNLVKSTPQEARRKQSVEVLPAVAAKPQIEEKEEESADSDTN
jgi:hypothetical protein